MPNWFDNHFVAGDDQNSGRDTMTTTTTQKDFNHVSDC